MMSHTDTDQVMTDSSTPSAVETKRAPLVELKNGKIILKQKLLSFEKMSETMQEIVKFRTMIEERAENKQGPLDAFPDEHRPLIAKMVHESDKTLQALTKHIHQELIQVNEEDEGSDADATPLLSTDAIEKAIKSTAERNDYGLESVAEGAKVPAGLHIWRWEVKQEHRDWLPKASREKAETRQVERQQAKKDVEALFASLSEEQQSALLGNKNGAKPALKWKPGCKNAKNANEPIVLDPNDSEAKPPSKKKISKGTEEQSSEAPRGPGRPKKVIDLEKLAKEKERQEKKAAKAEKEKKEKEAQDKSRSIMANFFGKAKAPTSNDNSAAPKHGGSNVAGPSSAQSDFVKTFKPFVLKKDAELAPVNWFLNSHPRSTKGKERIEGNVIILDDSDDEVTEGPTEDIQMSDLSSDVHLGQWTAQERLRDVLSHLPRSLNPPPRRKRPISHLKTYYPHSVRNIIAQMNEAEVAGDDARVRSLLALLRNRTLLPTKVLIFAEDARPGYFGTWTRSSREIGPRTPFARDVIARDYAYDSGEEWEEESGEADDVVEDAEEEDAGDEEDSDLGDWLVDDDEVEEPGAQVEERMGSPDPFALDDPFFPPPAPKRKAGGEGSKQNKKRKVVVPLVPFSKGPVWESRIGHCEYEPFHPYKIQLFNDTPYPIDPFTFVSSPTVETAARDGFPSNANFAVPSLPSRLVASAIVSPPTTDAAPDSAQAVAPKRTALAPKTPFPDALLPLLLSRITSLATGSLTYIVETVHQELKEQRVKKNAIEAKVREVGEKCKAQKVWVVKAEVKAAYGLA